MLSKDTILRLLDALNDKLQEQEILGEIGLCGGAVMCLVFNAREATRDVDAIFQPTTAIREAVKAVADDFDMPSDWLNDAAKGYFATPPKPVPFRDWSNLRVWAPSPEYMLAMKCVSARYDTTDADDVRFLVRLLRLTHPEQIYQLVSKYYPHEQVPAKTQFFIEELMQDEPTL